MKLLLVLMMVVSVFSCSTRTCKPNETIAQNQAASAQPQPVAGETKISPTTTMTNTLKKIKIYKPDGSVQCEQGTGTPAPEMAKQLGDIKVYSSENKHDGLIRTQVCGNATGHCNVYEINESDFAKAEKLGFKKWKNN
ncbi:hypothetical protein CIK05_08415 [Bdellovibrio sp. qaytius]|nr:hypothetical protein CIK05_08415 [Bdellovibrio sp. qaytius]